MRVLVVEDEPYLAEAVRDGLRLAAIAADIAPDGAVALDLLALNDYDVVVLDRDLPVVSGDEVARRMTAQGRGARIIMLTAADRLDDKEAAFASWCCACTRSPGGPSAAIPRSWRPPGSAWTRSAARSTATAATSP